MTNFWLKRQYAEASTEPDGLSKRGYVYVIPNSFFTINATSTVYVGLNTNGVTVEFQFYDITSDLQPVEARLIEAPTATIGNSPITPLNINRNYADDSTVSLNAYTNVSGGTVIASELVGSGSKAGGFISQAKIHVLKPNTLYVMSFLNTGNQATRMHLNLGWSEAEPLPKDLWTA